MLDKIFSKSSKIFSNATGDMVKPQRGSLSATAYLSKLNEYNAWLIVQYNNALNTVAAEQARYNDWASAPNPDWNFIQSSVQPPLVAAQFKRDGLKAQLDSLKAEIDLITRQSNAEIDAQLAANKLTLANANLTADQRLAIERQNAELELQKSIASSRSKNLRILVIVGAVALVFGIIGFVVYKLKRTKAA
jgi:hypothetical protein